MSGRPLLSNCICCALKHVSSLSPPCLSRARNLVSLMNEAPSRITVQCCGSFITEKGTSVATNLSQQHKMSLSQLLSSYQHLAYCQAAHLLSLDGTDLKRVAVHALGLCLPVFELAVIRAVCTLQSLVETNIFAASKTYYKQAPDTL